MSTVKAGLLAGMLLLVSGVALAAEPTFTLVIKNHRYQPDTITVPVGQRIKLVVENQDATPEEFDSRDLRREKILAPRTKAVIWVGPLPAGEYHFVGEFHEDTAKGRIIAR